MTPSKLVQLTWEGYPLCDAVIALKVTKLYPLVGARDGQRADPARRAAAEAQAELIRLGRTL